MYNIYMRLWDRLLRPPNWNVIRSTLRKTGARPCASSTPTVIIMVAADVHPASGASQICLRGPRGRHWYRHELHADRSPLVLRA